MKTFIIVSLLLAGIGQAQAQTSPLRAEQQREADAIHASVVDTEAMSWAWRIEKGKSLSYAELTRNSANWGRGEEVRGRLLAKVKEIINKDEVRLLTAKENDELASAKARVRAILSGERAAILRVNKRASRQAAIDAAAREMMDVEAKHWAWRIAVKGDITYDELKANSEGWLRGPEVSGELLKNVKDRLQSGETSALTKAEQDRLDAGTKKIKEIVSRA